MLKIGLTGGIGVGKTTVAKIFESFGIPVFYSDVESKNLMFDSQIKTQVIELFGEESYSLDQLNRKHIAAQLFEDPQKRTSLEELLHPRVRQEFQKWASNQNTPYVLNESALIFEKNLESYFDKIILVKAPLDLRISRVMERDKLTKAEVQARLAAQDNSSKNEDLSDFVIYNDNLSNLKLICKDIHNKLTQKF